MGRISFLWKKWVFSVVEHCWEYCGSRRSKSECNIWDGLDGPDDSVQFHQSQWVEPSLSYFNGDMKERLTRFWDSFPARPKRSAALASVSAFLETWSRLTFWSVIFHPCSIPFRKRAVTLLPPLPGWSPNMLWWTRRGGSRFSTSTHWTSIEYSRAQNLERPLYQTGT